MGLFIIIGICCLLYLQFGEKNNGSTLDANDILMKKYLNNEISEEDYFHKLDVINRK
ncbi:MAG: hypothetical protein PHI41_08950 [Erysipelotrichaceae bacterium]|nr:hypothetical protein [Erysipelotrichaceae bacterium]MDD3810484.1 hypothetical protein [Erysipelotrichaceae bacterium]